MPSTATRKQHNYLKKLDRMMDEGLIPFTSGVHEVLVTHDEGCGIFRGKRCNCDPDIVLLDQRSKRPVLN